MEEFINLAQATFELYGIRILGALAILVIGIWISKRLAHLARKLLDNTHLNDPMVSFMGSTAYFILLAFVIITALSHLGVETTSFVAILGAVGLAVGLAVQGTLANFASGVLLVIFRPFRGGDFITVGGISGIVEDIQFFSTRLRTPDNKVVYVPNAKITGDTITNFSAKETRRIDLTIGVSYDSNLGRAKEVIQQIISADERILLEPAPIIGVLELGDNGVVLAVRPWVPRLEYWNVYYHLLETIKLDFESNNIKIPYPQRDIHIIQDGNNS